MLNNNIGEWKFDDISDDFNDHVSRSIPMYDSIQKFIIDISKFFIKNNSKVLDIGCSTGTTIKLIKEEVHKEFFILGVDNSPNMIFLANKNLKSYNNAKCICKDICDFNIKNYDFIVSNLTLQFLNYKDKMCICKKVYNGLNPGGAFIIVEKIYSDSSKHQDIYTQLYHDIKEDNKFTPKEILDKDKAIRGVLSPMYNHENKSLLIECGFKVDEFFRYLNFVGYLALK